MIVGIGTDIAGVERVRQATLKHGEAFLERVFAEEERREAVARGDQAIYFAGRWAAKEAVSKALGVGMGKDCAWDDIVTLNEVSGKPKTTLRGQAARTAAKLGGDRLHVTISHERDYACAFAILETGENA